MRKASLILAAVFAGAAGTMLLIEQDSSSVAASVASVPNSSVFSLPAGPSPTRASTQYSLLIPQPTATTTSQLPLFSALRKKNASALLPGQPAPGIYEAKPYTMIVQVPGPHPDDRCIIGHGEGPKMPVKKPELRLEPRKPK